MTIKSALSIAHGPQEYQQTLRTKNTKFRIFCRVRLDLSYSHVEERGAVAYFKVEPISGDEIKKGTSLYVGMEIVSPFVF